MHDVGRDRSGDAPSLLPIDPSTRYLGYRTNSIIDSDPHSELHVMVCVHDEENVLAIINLLEISCPGQNSPIAVSVLTLSELKGRADALLLSGGKGCRGPD
ncbi:unnamed protein product [Cuscuta campestris]|uniref:Uncharacterized protein n=1 Tax=Cuscuta campestris TaxID=132261 RepID=A0A484NH26_9ASTE|nr:unnamed protein product [Cuscuta campestris]